MKFHKTHILFLVFSILYQASFSQTPDWVWAESAGSTNSDGAKSCTTDLNGNLYVTGTFAGPTITFGSMTLTNYDTTSFQPDIFIVKYDSNGNVIWAKSAGGDHGEEGEGIAADINGNVFITGNFFSTSITFGGFTLYNSSLMIGGDFFIVKYDSSGNVMWAESAEGDYGEGGSGISTDNGGNAYVTGSFFSPGMDFGPFSIINTSAGDVDMFLVKYDSNGNPIWAKTAKGTSNEVGWAIDADSAGNTLVTGSFMSPYSIFGTDTLFNSTNADEFFIAKYDSSGNVMWARSVAGNKGDYGQGVFADKNGNEYATGYFISDTITFGTTVFTNNEINSFHDDLFVVKYDPYGNIIWARSANGIGKEKSFGISGDNNGNICVVGSFTGDSLIFGTLTIHALDSGDFTPDIFIVKYDSNGNVLWAKSAGGDENEVAYSVAVDSMSVYTVGYFSSSTVIFGSDSLFLTNNFGYDLFVAKLGNNNTSISEFNHEKNLAVFPNPSTDALQLLFNSKETQTLQCEIVNIIGEIIYTLTPIFLQKNVKWHTEIDISLFPSGIYFIKMGSEVRKFVKE